VRYLHSAIRISDIDESLNFFCNLLGLVEVGRRDSEKGRYTNLKLAAPEDAERAKETNSLHIELTYNWDSEKYEGGRNFGHLAFAVDDIYDLCQRLMDAGITINRPPRDGHMAFVRTPDGISLELLQKDGSLPVEEPWASMPNTGSW
jgi:lactoylglutathione lyase